MDTLLQQSPSSVLIKSVPIVSILVLMDTLLQHYESNTYDWEDN